MQIAQNLYDYVSADALDLTLLYFDDKNDLL